MANASGIRAGAAYVELFLRDNRLVRGLNAAAARLKAFGASVTTLGTRLAGFGALLGTPLVAAVKTFADMGDHVAKAAARLGVTTEALSELRYATERSGGTADDLEKSLRAMSKTVIEAARGALDARRELQRLGLTVHDLSGLSSDQQLELIADRLAQIANPANRATIALGIFGKSGAKLLPLLAAGGRVILTTAEHPFYAQGKGWVAAGELEVGDRLAGEERGSWLTVTQLRSTSREVPVYNMRVADYHTYFVGDQDWGFAVWSHNTYAPTANERPQYYRPEHMNRHTGARLVNEAILYRWHNRLGHSRNVAVARYRDAQGRIRYMAAANTPGGPHAERNLLNRLHRQGIGANQIEALYTERSPCRRSCQPFLRQRGIPPERVYYSFNYNTPAGRRLARLYIMDEIASMNLLYGW